MITLAAAEAFVQEVREVRHSAAREGAGRPLTLSSGRARVGRSSRRPWRRLWRTGPAATRWRRRT